MSYKNLGLDLSTDLIRVQQQPGSGSVADPGCLSRIPDPTFFQPGSRIRAVSIPDPRSSSKNLSILTPKKSKKNGF